MKWLACILYTTLGSVQMTSLTSHLILDNCKLCLHTMNTPGVCSSSMDLSVDTCIASLFLSVVTSNISSANLEVLNWTSSSSSIRSNWPLVGVCCNRGITSLRKLRPKGWNCNTNSTLNAPVTRILWSSTIHYIIHTVRCCIAFYTSTLVFPTEKSTPLHLVQLYLHNSYAIHTLYIM